MDKIVWRKVLRQSLSVYAVSLEQLLIHLTADPSTKGNEP